MRECTIIIFGASGNLSKRKIFPALYQLIKKKQLNKLQVIGVALEKLTVSQLLETIKPFIADFDEETWKELIHITHYQQLDLTNEKEFELLVELIQTVETQQVMNGNRLLYCAVPSNLFAAITKHSYQAGIIEKQSSGNKKPWQRIVYEKPFGNSYDSAKKLNEILHTYLDENQVYRIDHYLAKELVANIALVRFTNRMFEPQWNNRDIASVEIILNETLDVSDRGAYYDQTGALRDITQNHLLELLALVAMEAPKTLTGADLQEQRAQVLKKTHFDNGLLGQYEGYQAISTVKSNSKTETFAALTLLVDNERWHGVPFYVTTGKCLAKKEKVIHLNFKPEPCRLTEGCPLPANRLTISITPDAGFSLTLNAKKPDTIMKIIPVKMEFCHECLFGVYTPQSYEVIIQEIIDGDQGLSVRFDEIEASWRIIDQIYQAKLPVYTYQKGSNGPKELADFEAKNKMRFPI